ncbi:methyltransferase domain-containing protein [Oleiagrimonas sp.]|jgi:SAM-dependent methyltransferase|uniref:methyltransferase domain-containing protein n=1 Tax=Oleiagrimonas sp. TaxID=2010330 RepID=UPI002624EEC3|nr:methyltransferase domain-containing protein [Oleiagrimonas sp.]MDA3913323.1 methyltransferase domain-containing protein [Oleiagrimonas sp.]
MPTAARPLRVLYKALHQLHPFELRFGRWSCPACGHRLHVRLRRDELAVRCTRCGASAISQSIIDVVHRTCPDLAERRVLELSAHGALARWLTTRAAEIVLSEYDADGVPGAIVDGVRNEDVQQLTFPDGRFDLITSTEVFEHVADDARGFAEVHRALAPGGAFVFTVPLLDVAQTHERATLREGQLLHLDTPEYHADAFTGSSRVLCFRDYGQDILERLLAAGFEQAWIATPSLPLFGYARKVLVARRRGTQSV